MGGYLYADFSKYNVYLKLIYAQEWYLTPYNPKTPRKLELFNENGKQYTFSKLIGVEVEERSFNGWAQPYFQLVLQVKTDDDFISDEKVVKNGWASTGVVLCTEGFIEEIIPKLLNKVLHVDNPDAFMTEFVETMYKFKQAVLEGLDSGYFTKKETDFYGDFDERQEKI